MRKLFFIAFMLTAFFFVGCNESQTAIRPAGGGNGIDVSSLRPQALDIIARALDDENGSIRSNAIETVSSANLKFMMPEVTKLLKDKFVGVRFAAAVAVGDMRYSPAKYAVKPY